MDRRRLASEEAAEGVTNPLFSPGGEAKCAVGRQYKARAAQRAEAYLTVR